MVLTRLLSFLRSPQESARPAGFIFVPHDEAGALGAAASGRTIRNRDDGPPWMVVVDAPTGVIPTRWPGRLLSVTVLRAVPDQPFPGSGNTRASAVRIEGETPAGAMFGERGDAVLEVLRIAARMDRETAAALAAERHPGAPEAFSRCWKRWLTASGEDRLAARDHRDTLIASGARSPVFSGFSLLQNLVIQRVRAVAGEPAFAREDEDEWLIGDWAEAAAALREAMMALGAAPPYLNDDRPLLLQAWESVGRSA